MYAGKRVCAEHRSSDRMRVLLHHFWQDSSIQKLYLPATGYSAEERKLVFYHELTHYCHRDLWYKMLLRICATIYWFNPFLLIMLKEADKDIENLCDTAVINRVNKKEPQALLDSCFFVQWR